MSDQRRPRTAAEAAAHVQDVINSASAFFTVYGDEDGDQAAGQFVAQTATGERYLFTAYRLWDAVVPGPPVGMDP